MITLSDIANIIYRDCAVFGVERVPDGQTPTGFLDGDRCVVRVVGKRLEKGKYWDKVFAEVNLCVPDLAPLYAEADTPRIGSLLSVAVDEWRDGVTGTWNGTPYYYGIHSTAILADTALRCHYANIRLLFQVLNTME